MTTTQSPAIDEHADVPGLHDCVAHIVEEVVAKRQPPDGSRFLDPSDPDDIVLLTLTSGGLSMLDIWAQYSGIPTPVLLRVLADAFPA